MKAFVGYSQTVRVNKRGMLEDNSNFNKSVKTVLVPRTFCAGQRQVLDLTLAIQAPTVPIKRDFSSQMWFHNSRFLIQILLPTQRSISFSLPAPTSFI